MVDIGEASPAVARPAAAVLPTGVVTFLFTDVVGSTAAWEVDKEAMSAAMARHDEVIERIVAQHGGVVVRPRGEGDSRFAVFSRPSAAVATALDVQRAMAVEAWDTKTPMRLRVAVHTGEAELRAGDYYGTVVNRAARLRSLAHPGQVVLGGATAELVRDELPAGSVLLDLGPVRLRDVARPERVHQLTHPDLQDQFPPPRGVCAAGDIPAVGSSLVGRAIERAQLVSALADTTVRLVTLTGPGGCGKTRLALATVADLVDERSAGVWFVPLDGVSDPEAVTAGILAAMGLVDQPGDDIAKTVSRAVTSGRALLVLDNFEQVLGAADVVAAILGAAPALQVLVTSREPLRLSCEREFPVPVLGLPTDAMLHDPAALATVDSVTLFVERARAVLPSFTLTSDNAAAVAELCIRLDGLPLAIELAAARARALPPRALLELLGRRLDVLTRGNRDVPARQQTLRRALDWSWDLLGEAEQDVLRSMSVFVGGCTLDAARAVCRPQGDVLDDLCRLVERSLVVADHAAGARFRLLETVQEYAAERLWESGHAEEVCRRHRELFVDLGERLSAGLAGAGRLSSLAGLDEEYGNLRAALGWSIEAGDSELALRLGAALGPFWLRRSRLSEGRGWLRRVLDVAGGEGSEARARVLTVAAALAFEQGDTAASSNLAGEAQCLFDQCASVEGAASARLLMATIARLNGDTDAARRLATDALDEFRAVGDRAGEAGALRELGMIARRSSDGAEARRLLEESLRLFGAGAADPVLQPRQQSQVLTELALLAGLDGDAMQAGSLLKESLGLSRSMGHRVGVGQCLDGFAVLAAERNEHERAAVLLGAAEAVREAAEAAVGPAERPERERLLARLLEALGPAGFARAHGRGRSMTLPEAMVFAEDAGAPAVDTTEVDTTDGATARRSGAGRQVGAGLPPPASTA